MEHFTVEKRGSVNICRWVPCTLSLSTALGVALISKGDAATDNTQTAMHVCAVRLSSHHEEICGPSGHRVASSKRVLSVKGMEVLLMERGGSRSSDGQSQRTYSYTERRGGKYEREWTLRFASVEDYKHAVCTLELLQLHAHNKRTARSRGRHAPNAAAGGMKAQIVTGLVTHAESPVEYGEAAYIAVEAA